MKSWKFLWPVAIVVTIAIFGVPAFARDPFDFSVPKRGSDVPTQLPSLHQTQTIECVGVLKAYPVHDFHAPELRNGHRGLEVTGNQSKNCDHWFDGKNWKKVTNACHQDKLCRVVGVIGPSGWKRIIKAEDYSLAGQRVNEARTAPPLEPFLFFSDLNGSYQGNGWIKHDLLVGCHKVEGEGGEMITQCSVSVNASVQQNPHSHLIAGLSKGTKVLVGEHEGEWVKIETDCSESIAPGSWEGHDNVFRFSCPEKAQ